MKNQNCWFEGFILKAHCLCWTNTFSIACVYSIFWMKYYAHLPKKLAFRNWSHVQRGPSVMWYSDRKWKILINDCCRTLSGHFFAICMFIFHKTEVLKVILRCLTGLNYDWFKSYDTRRKISISFFFAILYKNRSLRLLCFLS